MRRQRPTMEECNLSRRLFGQFTELRERSRVKTTNTLPTKELAGTHISSAFHPAKVSQYPPQQRSQHRRNSRLPLQIASQAVFNQQRRRPAAAHRSPRETSFTLSPTVQLCVIVHISTEKKLGK